MTAQQPRFCVGGGDEYILIFRTTNDKDKILEKVIGIMLQKATFLGVYIDKNENDLLGSNRFDYSYYLDRQNKMIEAPKMGPP